MKRHRRRAGSIGARPSWGPHSLLSCSSPSWVPSSLVSFSSLLRLFFLCLWRRWLSPSSLSCCLLGGGEWREERKGLRAWSGTALPQLRPKRAHRAAQAEHWDPEQEEAEQPCWGTALPWEGFLLTGDHLAPRAAGPGSGCANCSRHLWHSHAVAAPQLGGRCAGGNAVRVTRVVLCLFIYNKQLYIVSVSIPLLRELW